MRGKLMIFILVFISMFLFFSCSNDPVNAMIENTTSILVKNETSNNNTATASMTLIAQNDAENEEETETEELLETEIDYETIADTVFKSESYTYKSKYRKDPFVSVLELQREGLNEIEIETASYFGMIQGENGKMALFKDATGMGYVFYEGQKIKNGVLLRIAQDSVIFKLQEYGTVRNKVIPLQTSSYKK